MLPKHSRVVVKNSRQSLRNPKLRHAIHKERFRIDLIRVRRNRHVLMIIRILTSVEMNLMDRLLCL